MCTEMMSIARRYRKTTCGLLAVLFLYITMIFFTKLSNTGKRDDSLWQTGNQGNPTSIPGDVNSLRVDVAPGMTSMVQSSDADTLHWLRKRQELLSAGGKKKVMLFCYMRGGSTFFSELFRQNEDVMYWYEPYDAFYSYLFGEKTWHFPQDIFWYQHSQGNSSLRKQDDWELDEMAWFNHKMLTCNYSGLPVELYYHKGLGKTNMVSFRNCVLTAAKNKDPQNCRSNNLQRCSGNSKLVFDNNCPQNIKRAQKYAKQSYNKSINTEVPEAFVNHARCNDQFPKWIKNCTHILEDKCKKSKMVTYKGLRVTMTSAERMLQLDPDLHIVYFVRDPRGTATSRINIGLTYRDTKKNIVLEAKYHCAKMLADLNVYSRLKEQYPGAILLVKYEDVTQNPYDEIERIYNFFGMCVHHSVHTWMKKNEEVTGSGGVYSTARANSTASIDKWRRSNTPKAQELMTQHCKQVLQALNYTL